jgi:hypothetical protein
MRCHVAHVATCMTDLYERVKKLHMLPIVTARARHVEHDCSRREVRVSGVRCVALKAYTLTTGRLQPLCREVHESAKKDETLADPTKKKSCLPLCGYICSAEFSKGRSGAP